ncbi:hypothetical protein [Silvibacterium acidisoli]|uniref:hypothetical protein n=1 Tax=Acidobacteriaceae bacterium ZG23-2 TaxID=2883246 RepID=UPI00406C7D4E
MKNRLLPAIAAMLLFAAPSILCAQDGPPKIQMVNYVGSVQGSVDASSSKAGDAVKLTILNDAKLNDGTDVAKGSILEGHIDSITPSEKKSDSKATLTFDKISVNGKEIPIRSWILNVGTGSSNGSQSLKKIDGLTSAYSAQETTSGTLTQKKKDIKLTDSTQMVVTVAVIPEGVTIQQ